MSAVDPTSPEAVERLLAPAPGQDAGAPAGPRSVVSRVRSRARSTGRSVAQRQLGPIYQKAIARVSDRVGLMVRDAVDGDPAINQVRDLAGHGAFDRPDRAQLEEQARVDRLNLELLKGEVRHLQARLEELGMAFAPGTGIDGAGARFAELREAVRALERRLRNAPTATAAAPSGEPAGETAGGTAGGTAGPAVVGEPAPRLSSTLFDYVGFERRFRGDPEEILTTLVDRYGELLTDHQPVVDVGCGRGELLSKLAEQGVEVIGIEPDPGMASEARATGITVHEELAGPWLRSVPDHSLGSIITTHVLEHLELDDLIEMLELSVRKLRPGGVFISETPNPASLIVLGNSYLLDPTHVRPLHPSLLSFLCETAGFRDVRLKFFSPATGYHLPMTSTEGGEDLPTWATDVRQTVDSGFTRLNDVLFGPQDYAVVASTAP